MRSVSPLILISDVTCRIFGDLLPHTPIGMMGINRSVHFDVGSAREKIGNILAPKEPWGKWGEDVMRGEGKHHGGLLSMTIIQKDVDDRPAGSIQAKVEPSGVIGRGRTGIFMEVNDHYSIPDPSGATDALEIMDLLRNRFDSSIQRSEGIIDQIMSLRDAS